MPIDVGSSSSSSSSSNNTNGNPTTVDSATDTAPMDEKLDAFDPTNVPTVGTLLAEIDAWDARHGVGEAGAEARNGIGGVDENENENQNNENDTPSQPEKHKNQKTADYEKTSLKPYVDHFRRFVAALLRDEGFGGSTVSGGNSGNGKIGKKARAENNNNDINNNTAMAGGGGRGIGRGGGYDPMEF